MDLVVQVIKRKPIYARYLLFRRKGAHLQREKRSLETLGYFRLHLLVVGRVTFDIGEIDRLAEDHSSTEGVTIDSIISLVHGVPWI